MLLIIDLLTCSMFGQIKIPLPFLVFISFCCKYASVLVSCNANCNLLM